MISENKSKNFPLRTPHGLKWDALPPFKVLPEVPWIYFGVVILMGAIAAFDFGLPHVILFPLAGFLFVSLFFKTIVNSIYVLMALIIYIPYSKVVSGNLGGAVTGLNFTTILLLLAVLGIYIHFKNNLIETPLPLELTFRKLVILFCLFGALSILHTDIVVSSYSVLSALVDYKRWLEPFFIFFIFSYLVRKEEEGRTIIYLMAVTLVVIGIGSIWQRHELGERSHFVRLTGIAGQSNTMGAFYANYIFVILGYLLMKGLGYFRKSIFALGFLGCLFGLFATESRGDALAFVCGLMLFFFLRNKLLFIGVVAGIVFLTFNLQFLPAGLRQRVQHTVTQQNSFGLNEKEQLDLSSRTRLAVWTGALRMIVNHPIFGVGYGMFPFYIYDYVDHNEETAHLGLQKRDGHEAYLMIAAEMGLPALMIFLIILFFMFRISLQSYLAGTDFFWKTVSACSLSSLTSLSVSNLFGSRAISLILAGYIWALLAILLKVPKWAKEHSEKSVENSF